MYDLTYRLVAAGRHLYAIFSDGTRLPMIRGGADEPRALDDLLADAARITELTDDELATLDADLVAAAEDRAENPDDDMLAELETIQTAVTSVREEHANRETAATERAERAAAALDAIRGEEDPEEGETTEVAEPAAEATETEPVVAETEPVVEPVVAEVPEPVAVAAAARPRIGRVAARRPASARPTPAAMPSIADLGLVASANVANIAAGEPLQDEEKLAYAFASAIESTRGYVHGPPVHVPVARAGNRDLLAAGFTADRILDRDFAENGRKIRAVTSPESITAAGGICAPPAVRYDVPVIGSDARPFRDNALARFGADRGGITTLPPPILTDLTNAVGAWTAANDANPTEPTVKPCLTVTCPDPETTSVEAITRCLEFGNFNARYLAENIDAWVRLAGVQHARFAESRMITAVGTGSTQTTSGQLLGATRDVLATLDRAIAGYQSRWRDDGLRLRWAYPFWLIDMMRADLAREMPGATAERLAMADAQIEAFFVSRDVNTTAFLDGETGQIFGPQGDGPLEGWPSTAITYLYPEGDWLSLDGGMLDLGIVRDSTLNSTNDVQMFAETFEGVHHHGNESLRIAIDACPDGSFGNGQDIDPCSTGS